MSRERLLSHVVCMMDCVDLLSVAIDCVKTLVSESNNANRILFNIK